MTIAGAELEQAQIKLFGFIVSSVWKGRRALASPRYAQSGSHTSKIKNEVCFDRRRRRLGRPECLGVAPVGPEDAPRAGPERAGHGVVQRPGAANVRETIIIIVSRGTTARI